MTVQKVLSVNSAGISQMIPVGVQVSSGSASAGQAAVLNSSGVLDPSLIGPTTNQSAVILTSESINAGAFVNIWNNSGVATVRNASASSISTSAVGYVSQTYSSGVNATVYFTGNNVSVTGATPGKVWLGTVPGSISSSSPSGAGVLSQPLGIATSSTNISVNISTPIILAS
jgi:hypothetical protein